MSEFEGRSVAELEAAVREMTDNPEASPARLRAARAALREAYLAAEAEEQRKRGPVANHALG